MAGATKGQSRRPRRDVTADPPLPLGGSPGESAEASWDVGDQPAKPPRAQRGQRPPAYAAFPYIAGALALALIGVAIAGYLAASMLGNAVRAAARRGAATPGALAATVCADLTKRDYADLVARIDPTPAPPAVTGAYDAAAMSSHLAALDHTGGRVTSCAVQTLSPGQVAPPAGPDGASRVLLTIWRENTPRPIAAVLVTREGPDSAWLIERDSSFLLAS